MRISKNIFDGVYEFIRNIRQKQYTRKNKTYRNYQHMQRNL
ncbi:hypothetical protein ECDEC4F_0872 [Escherichia coli DEC4F]|nr:hypothetical protein ECDEC4F_0872 [Escherichia coli DEC4F]